MLHVASVPFHLLNIVFPVVPEHIFFFFSLISTASFIQAINFSAVMVMTPECFTFRAVKSSC